MRKIVAAVLVFALSACSTVAMVPTPDDEMTRREAHKQRQLVVEDRIADLQRVLGLAHPILRQSADLCGKTVAEEVGFRVFTPDTFDAGFRAAYASLYGSNPHPTILVVIADSAAERAGLRPGDVPNAVGEWTVPVGKTAAKEFSDRLKQEMATRPQVPLTVLREGQAVTVEIGGEPVCDYPVMVSGEDMLNAFADSRNVVLMKGMLRFTNDDELAVIIGHEVAHNLMRHIQKSQGNAFAGLLIDLLFAGFGVSTGGAFSDVGRAAFSQDFEREADYVGLYLAARGGHDISVAPNLWRRMGMTAPGAIARERTASHPSTPERFLALEQTVAEIEDKRARGLPLVPEIKVEGKSFHDFINDWDGQDRTPPPSDEHLYN